MVTNERSITLNVDEEYLKVMIRAIDNKYDKIEPFYNGLVKSGLIKLAKKHWMYDPDEYDFVFRIKSDITDTPDFLILTKSTLVDLLKRRKVIQFIIFNQLHEDRGLLQDPL